MLHQLTMRGDRADTLKPIPAMTTTPTLPQDVQTRINTAVRPAPTYPLPWRVQPLIGEHSVSMVNVVAANGETVVMAIYATEAARILAAVNRDTQDAEVTQ